MFLASFCTFLNNNLSGNFYRLLCRSYITLVIINISNKHVFLYKIILVFILAFNGLQLINKFLKKTYHLKRKILLHLINFGLS